MKLPLISFVTWIKKKERSSIYSTNAPSFYQAIVVSLPSHLQTFYCSNKYILKSTIIIEVVVDFLWKKSPILSPSGNLITVPQCRWGKTGGKHKCCCEERWRTQDWRVDPSVGSLMDKDCSVSPRVTANCIPTTGSGPACTANCLQSAGSGPAYTANSTEFDDR